MGTHWIVLTSLLALLSFTNGHISDDDFRIFCMGKFLDFPDGLEPEQRVGDETCTQLVPHYSDDSNQRMKICNGSAPYTVLEAEAITSPKNMTWCLWKKNYQCKLHEKLLYNKCLSKTPVGTYEDVSQYCLEANKQASLLEVTNRIQTQWLIKLYSQNNNVWVANDQEHAKALRHKDQSMGFSSSNYDYGLNYKQFSVVGSLDWELGVYSGMLMPTNKEERLVGFCSRDADESRVDKKKSTEIYCIETHAQRPSGLPYIDGHNAKACMADRSLVRKKCFSLANPGKYDDIFENCPLGLYHIQDSSEIEHISQLLSDDSRASKVWVGNWFERSRHLFPCGEELIESTSILLDTNSTRLIQGYVAEFHLSLCDELSVTC